MIEIYELGKSINVNYKLKIDEKLKFTLFPYKGSDIINTASLLFIFFVFAGVLLEYLFDAEILFTTCIFFGFVVVTIAYLYPTQVYYLLKITEYKQEMLNMIMRFSTYLSMKSNMEYAVYNSLDYTKGILKVQFEDILLKLERKEYINIGAAFKHYSKTWNQYSPEFVDSLKLLEVASLSSKDDAEKIIEDAISQILLSYNIEQKRSSEELTEKISRVISVGIMLPVMFLMLVPLVSIFMPDVIKASMLFLMFDILIPTFLFVNALNFSAKRLQLSNIEIENSKDYKKTPVWVYILSVIALFIFLIPAVIYLIYNDPRNVTFESFNLRTIFFVWLIPAGISLAIYIMTKYYHSKNKKIWKEYQQIEEDIPHLLNYFSTYLNLNVPMENIFQEITTDYKKHGFQNHPTVSILEKISFKLYHLKTNLKQFIRNDLKKISSIKSLNAIFEQISSFGEFSLREASKVSKKIREQRVSIIKLNDYILTLLNSTISFVGTTIVMLAPLLSSLAIIMSLFIVTFIKFLTKQLEAIANLGGGAGGKVDLNLIQIENIISPIYLELIIAFYVVEIIIILAIMKSNIKYGYSNFNIIKTIKESQIGFIVFSMCLFGGYFFFKIMFIDSLNLG